MTASGTVENKTEKKGEGKKANERERERESCLLYTSDAADER